MRLKLEDLAKKLAAGLTDKEIMQDLKLKRRTFYYYKAKVCRMFGNIAEKNTGQALEFEAEMLKDRYIRRYRNLEQRTTDRNTKLRDAANASELAAMMQQTSLDLRLRDLGQDEQEGS